MERIISPEERIRRAEDIYYRRKMQNGIRVSTSKVNTSARSKYILYKKLILQILICFFIYIIFYLIKNSNYIFSEEIINKSKQILSYDINFQRVYNVAMEYYDVNLKPYFTTSITDNIVLTNTINSNEISNEIDNEITNTESIGGIGGGEDEKLPVNEAVKQASAEAVAQLSQMEIDANVIKTSHSFVLPLSGIVSSRYGPRQGSSIVSSNHAGIDIAANEGTVFCAAMSGNVVVSSSEGSYGNHLFIQEGNVITVYAHCKKLYVKNGDKVKQGQQLGEVGHTGNATGPHLHFEIRIDGRTVNPELILNFG